MQLIPNVMAFTVVIRSVQLTAQILHASEAFVKGLQQPAFEAQIHYQSSRVPYKLLHSQDVSCFV